MEDKKTFGAYILRRRRELGLTQKAFAQKLYVTESAVSKWERGLSYPDITLLGTICEVLGVSEHELLTGSEDTQTRRAEHMAEKYLRLTRNYRRAQYILYGLILLGCLIGALISGELGIFFIALPSVLMAASLTLLPALTSEHPVFGHCRASLALGAFTASLELLLLCCCILVGGDWFPIVSISVLFGMTLVFLPFLLRQLPLPEWIAARKTSAYLILETVLLILLLLVSCVQTGGDWFLVAALGVIFGLGFIFLPIFLRQLPLPEPARRHKLLIYFSVQTILLLILIFLIELGDGLDGFLTLDLPVTGLCLLLPWGVMLLARYLPISGWYRGSLCVAWTALWTWLSPFALEWLLSFHYNYIPIENGPLRIPFDLRVWDSATAPWNIFVLILFALAAIALALFLIGWRKCKR